MQHIKPIVIADIPAHGLTVNTTRAHWCISSTRTGVETHKMRIMYEVLGHFKSK